MFVKANTVHMQLMYPLYPSHCLRLQPPMQKKEENLSHKTKLAYSLVGQVFFGCLPFAHSSEESFQLPMFFIRLVLTPTPTGMGNKCLCTGQNVYLASLSPTPHACS